MSSWRAFSLFRLSRTQLARTGATSGAIAGGLIDAAPRLRPWYCRILLTFVVRRDSG